MKASEVRQKYISFFKASLRKHTEISPAPLVLEDDPTTLFTSSGKLKILNKKYALDKKSIDAKCFCFVCKNYSKAYIRHLLKEDEAVGKELASYHNLYYFSSQEEVLRNL